jgi:hypothetical protein
MLEGKVSHLVIKYVMRVCWVGVDMATEFGTVQWAMRGKAGHVTTVLRSLPEIDFSRRISNQQRAGIKDWMLFL